MHNISVVSLEEKQKQSKQCKRIIQAFFHKVCLASRKQKVYAIEHLN